ncbi:MAG: proline--tRNA ligase, partial [Nitrososphaeraceae archaeon]|nr:proline--tRNA ligase [Nitrososphaeraceae archaeon]
SWCGKLGCEEKIKEETGADIRVIPFDDSLDMKTCVYCNEPSTKTVFFAKAY